MGDQADYYIDLMERGIISTGKAPKIQPKVYTWTTADGNVLEIKTMESSHILNCIHSLERREAGGIEYLDKKPTYRYMVNQLIYRGYISDNYCDLTLEERVKVRY